MAKIWPKKYKQKCSAETLIRRLWKESQRRQEWCPSGHPPFLFHDWRDSDDQTNTELRTKCRGREREKGPGILMTWRSLQLSSGWTKLGVFLSFPFCKNIYLLFFYLKGRATKRKRDKERDLLSTVSLSK